MNNGKHNETSNTLFIKACFNIGDTHKSTKLIKSFQTTNDGDIEFIINSVINFYVKIGDVNNVINTFENIFRNKKDIIIIGAMIICFIDDNQNKKAISINEQYNGEYNDISNYMEFFLSFAELTQIGQYHASFSSLFLGK